MHRHTRQLSLVRDKGLQLSERPRMECCALRPSSPHPRANVRQVLQRDRPLCAFGRRNNPFGKAVIDMFGKPALFPRQLPQSAAATECSPALELVSQPPMPIAHLLDRVPAMDFSIAIDCDVRDTQVDAQNILDVDRVGHFNHTPKGGGFLGASR